MQISVAEFGATERRAPRCAEAVAGPCFAESVSNCTRRLFRPSRVEHDFQGCADWDHNSFFLFSLPLLVRLQSNVRPVVLRPGDVSQRPLTLAGPKCEQQRKLQFWRCYRAERRNVLGEPNDFGAIGFV